MCGGTGLQMLRHKRSAAHSCWRNLPVDRHVHVDSSVRCEIFMEAMLAITPLWGRTTNYLCTTVCMLYLSLLGIHITIHYICHNVVVH